MENVLFSMSHAERIYAGVILFTALCQLIRMAVITFGEGELVHFLRIYERRSFANVYLKYGWIGYIGIAASILFLHIAIMFWLQWYASMCFVTLYFFIVACWQVRKIAAVSQDDTFLATFS